MKALILAGGSGTRMRPFTHSLPKQLLPIVNRPMLHHVLDAVAEAGVGEADTVVVVSPESHLEVRKALADRKAITFVEQTRPRGIADAALVARDALGDDDFLMCLGDNLIGDSVAWVRQFPRFDGVSVDAALVAIGMPDPSRFGVVQVNAHGEAIGLEEKPAVPKSDLALVGMYVFRPRIWEAIHKVAPSARGELEMTDAINALLGMGGVAKVKFVRSWYVDLGDPADLLRANKLLLDRIDLAVQGTVDNATVIEGRVQVGAGATVEASELHGPVVVGEGAVVRNSNLGPNVSIGAGATVEQATVANSIVMAGAHLGGGRIEDSILGRRSEVAFLRGTSAMTVLVGDHARVGPF